MLIARSSQPRAWFNFSISTGVDIYVVLTLLLLKGQDDATIAVLNFHPIRAIKGHRIIVNPT